MSLIRPIAACACLMLAACNFALAEEDFKPLFDGKSFDAWEQHGGKAKYTIEGDEVVGTSVAGSANSFMCTKKEYGDFILEFEFKVDPNLNSGVQIRSKVFDKETEVDAGDGTTKKIPADRVHGYQVEIDPAPRAFTGGIYDEARRGKFLADLSENQKAREAFKQNEWNQMRVICKGDQIQTWINGVPAVDLKDGVTRKGLIALQVHAVNAANVGKEVRWRKIRIKEL